MFSLSLPGPVRRYFDNWFETHNPPSGDSILLHNRRLYILPTGFGYLFGFMLFFLFMAALNELVWRTQTESFWVSFKTFAGIPITLAFIASQFPMLKRHAKPDGEGA